MSAYDLADEFKNRNWDEVDCVLWCEKSANMLRQQADRIAELEKELKRTKFAWNLAENEIERLASQKQSYRASHEGFSTIIDKTTSQTKPENVWTSCVACGQRVTADSIHTCSPQTKPQCEHEIVDARNEFVESGYMCIKCMSLFKGRHTTPQTKPLSDKKKFTFEFDTGTWGAKEIAQERADNPYLDPEANASDFKKIAELLENQESRIVKEMNETYADLNQSLTTKRLTDEEIHKLANKYLRTKDHDSAKVVTGLEDFARAIEERHGIK